MISLQWQDGVLSLLDQAAYPQQERWITCSTLEETVQALSSGAVLEEKIAAVAGAYGYCQAAIAAQDLQQTPQFQQALDEAKAKLLASRPIPGTWPPPCTLWRPPRGLHQERRPPDHPAGHRRHL